MEIKLSLEVPSDMPDDLRMKVIESDISTIISTVYSTIPLSERNKIVLKDKSGEEHKFTSFEQIKFMFRKEGYIDLTYSGKNHQGTGDYLPTRD